MIDNYGRTIGKSGTTYTCSGISVTASSDPEAVNTFNGMAPNGWSPPYQDPYLVMSDGSTKLVATGLGTSDETLSINS